MRSMIDAMHVEIKKWDEAKAKLLEDVKGTPESKLVKMIFKQHEVKSFEYNPHGFMDERGGVFEYRITYTDHQSMANEHVLDATDSCGTRWRHNPIPTHVAFFKRLPI